MTTMRTCLALCIGLTTLNDAEAGQAPIVRKDCFGDPLPVGAVARLGTVRFSFSGAAAYSPNGKWIAAGYDDAAYLLDPATGKKLHRLPYSKEVSASAMIFSRSGRKLAVVSFGGSRIDLWDLKTFTKKNLIQFKNGSFGGVGWRTAAVFTPDEKVLYASTTMTLFHWDTATGKLLKRIPFRIDGRPVGFSEFGTVYFAPDGKILGTKKSAENDEPTTVFLWDVESGKLKNRIKAKERWLDCLAFSRNGKIVAAGGRAPSSRSGYLIHLWNANTGQEIASFPANGRVHSMLFSVDGKTLISAHNDLLGSSDGIGEQSIQIRILTTPGKPPQKIKALGINSVLFSPDEKILAWRCCGETFRFVDRASQKEMMTLDSHCGIVRSVVFSPEGETIATGSEDGTVRIWHAKKTNQLRLLGGHESRVNAVAFSLNGKLLASASRDRTAIIWNAKSGKKTFHLPNHGNEVYDVKFCPNGKQLAIAIPKVSFWDPFRGERLLDCDFGGFHLAYSPDGKTLAAALDFPMHSLQFLSVQKKTIRKMAIDKSITAVQYSPDGMILAVGCNKTLYLLDAITSKKKKILPGHANSRGCLAFSPDGRYLASGGDGAWQPTNPQMLQIFELLTCTEIHRFKRDVPVYSVAFSPDGTKLATGREDATALIWHLRNLTGKKRRANLSPNELAACWQALGKPDAKDAYEARVDLLHAPKIAVPFLAKHLHPAPVIKSEHVKRLLRDLGDKTFRKRSKAQQELEQFAELVEKPLRSALKTKMPLETHLRIDRLLAKFATIPPPHRLRQLRAIEILEGIGSPEAWQTLTRIAKGNPAGLVTAHARAALRRKKAKPFDR